MRWKTEGREEALFQERKEGWTDITFFPFVLLPKKHRRYKVWRECSNIKASISFTGCCCCCLGLEIRPTHPSISSEGEKIFLSINFFAGDEKLLFDL
jgi:hypothetical protein